MTTTVPTQPAPAGEPSHTCVHCGATSRHPDDVRERYCARCHHFCDDIDYWDRLKQVPLF